MGTTLHEVASEFKPVLEQLDQMLLDGEIDEQSFTDTIESAAVDLDLKIENVAKFISYLDSLSAGMGESINSMKARKQAVDNRITSLKQYLSGSMEFVGYSKFERPDIRISFRKTKAVVIDDESKLNQFKVEKITYSYPKAEIKKAIESGEQVEGAHIEENKNIIIKG
jgi:hypothetical protein